METLLSHLGNMGDFLAVIVPCFLWFRSWAKNLETTVGLTKQVATTHLPFIYSRLGEHDNALGLRSPDHQNIGFIPNGSK